MSNLAWFGSMVERLMGREDLDRKTVKEMFSQVLRDEQPELHQGAFLAALAAKGETAEEVAGAWEAIRDVDTIPVHLDVSTPVMDNCGTGRDRLKTFNISTAASVVAANNEVFCLSCHQAHGSGNAFSLRWSGASGLTAACQQCHNNVFGQ